jgi:signal peptidase I
MSESSVVFDPSKNSDETGVSHPRPRWGRAILAGTLSLFVSGMGQLYNRQARRALLFGAVSYLFAMVFWRTRILLAFPTMIWAVTLQALWKVFVVIEAAYAAAKNKMPEGPVPMPRVAYPLLVISLIAGALWPSFDMVKQRSGFGAFTIPSRSMCPTICLGDRVVVDMNAYRTQKVQRGDLIVMKHASSDALFVKRVIGLPGDLVAPGPNGSVLVNGQVFRPAAPCAMPQWEKRHSDPADYSEFHETRVADGNYFVVGDNLGDSFDSRIAAFGAVTADMVRGRPLYLYWSPTLARVGCAVR